MLPKIETPTFKTTLPSDNTEVTYRPFLTKEQKNILIVSQGGEVEDVVNGVVELVNACTFDKYDWYSRPAVDVEWMFLNIRAKSIGEIVELTTTCAHDGCGHKNRVEVDLREAKVREAPDYTVKWENISIVFERPSLKKMLELAYAPDDKKVNVVASMVKYVTEGEEVYTEFTADEFAEFVDSLPVKCIEEIQKIFEDDPLLYLQFHVKCPKCGHEGEVTVEGLLNFFT